MNSRPKNRFPFRPCLAVAILAGALSLQSCKDDILTGQPSWLGESIYAELQNQGNYTTLLHLIDDLGLKEQMSHTGSLTLFAADDATYDEWFKTNTWGVRSYSQLTTAQKKMLLYSQEINNAYLVELMSNSTAKSETTTPEAGKTMRRANASSIFDTTTVAHWQYMPNTEAWSYYRKNHKNIIIYRDGRMLSGSATTSNLSQPMIHFLPAFMQKQGFTDEDVSILTNGVATSTNDAFVSGHKITERDITCKNGYIQKMDGVIEPLPNMAQIIRNHSVMSGWSRLLDRFCAPYYDRAKTTEYNRLHNTNVDSVFTLRYFADRRNSDGLSTQNLPPTADYPDGKPATATLPFDPGWNQYLMNSQSADMHSDAAAMLVPSNKALNEYWNKDGRVLQDMYGSWDKVPDNVIAPLLSVNMLPSFVSSIPSKFSTVLNDAQTELGLTKADVDSVFLGCNGVVYMTNKVFPPMEYSSVLFPALVHEDILNVIYSGIKNLEFRPYLNSMDSYYSLILPTNSAMKEYIDPCTMGDNLKTMLDFYYDASGKYAVGATRYSCDVADDGAVTSGTVLQKSVSDSYIKNRLNDLINNLIIVGNIEDGHEYYKTKTGSIIRVNNAGKSNMTISGGWQMDHGNPSKVSLIYDQSTSGNGKAYVVESNIPQSSANSVYQVLKNHEEYSEFLSLLQGSQYLSSNDQILLKSMVLNSHPYYASNSNENYNVSLFGNYNYTVYVPTNSSIKALETKGVLPTWEDYDKAYADAGDTEDTICKIIKNRILNFVKYHIQDNAVLINMAPDKDSEGNALTTNDYETMMLNPTTNRFYPLNVNFSKTSMTIKDHVGNTRHVLTSNSKLYNNVCREYWIDGNDYRTKTLYASADAVVHLIDGPLFYSSSQETSWKTAAKRYLNRAKRFSHHK